MEDLAAEQTGRRGSITMYIMTSEMTMAPTVEFFEKHGYFGMKKEQVLLFEQRMIPCFDFQVTCIGGSTFGSQISRAG